MAAIDVHNLTKHFGTVKAVDGISFSVEKEEIFGFLGPNGAGKTTTIRCMMDFLRPTGGSITILDKDSVRNGVELKKHIGHLAGRVDLYNKWTGNEHIDFLRHVTRREDNADELFERLEFDPSKKAKNLSSGNRQKLGVIMAFMFKPEILILDEPTATLDPLLQNTIYDMLAETAKDGTTVFMSSHNLAEVDRVCGRIGIIRDGKMVADENIHTLKEKRVYTVHAYFDGPFDKAVFDLPNVEIASAMDDGLILRAKGDPDPVVHALVKYKLRDLTIQPASLEEIFMEYYTEENHHD